LIDNAAYNNRGFDYARLGQYQKACDDFYQAGLLYLKYKDKTEALKYIDLMKKFDPTSPLIKKLMEQL